MRVTENTNYDTIRGSIRRSRERMEGLQQQSGTMKKLNTPSDDPVGAAKIMEIRTDKVNNDQLQMNSKMVETFLGNTDHALSDLAEVLLRAKEIAIGQSSGASSNESTRLGVAEEVTQLFKQSIAVANRRIGDRYIFGGYRTLSPPVEPGGGYLGDDGQMMIEIGKGVFLSMNIPGIEAFNTSPQASSDSRRLNDANLNRSPAEDSLDAARQENLNVFDELQNLRISLLTGDIDGIRDALERFDQLHAKITATRAKVGSRMQGLQNMVQSAERHNLVNAQLSSNLEDADMAQVVSDLAKEETVFRSALSSSQKLIQPTLLQFLK